MPLLHRASPTDTWPELKAAADVRFEDGLVLATDRDPRTTGAVYLLGYVAEMLIKVSYYQVRGVPAANDVSAELSAIRGRAAALGLTWTGNLHNIVNLATLLVLERMARGNPMPHGLAAEFLSRVIALSMEWSEQLRYKSVTAGEREVREVFEHVDWIHRHYALLWS